MRLPTFLLGLSGLLVAMPMSAQAASTQKAAAKAGAVCVDPALHGETGPVCRIACAGFFIDVRSGEKVYFANRDLLPGRIWTLAGKLNGEGKFTDVSVVGSAATACAFTGFDINGPINPALRPKP